MRGVTFDELRVPARPDDDFRALIALQNVVEAQAYGSDELATLPEEELPAWHDSFEPHRALLARVDGEVVGTGIYQYSTEGARDLGWLTVAVSPEHRRRGIGSTLHQHLIDWARADGRTALQCYALAPKDGGERLVPPTGFGSVARDDPTVQFLLHHGWSLEQVERCSRLALPVPEELVRALSRESPGYRFHHYADHTPERWRADVAHLHTRMSTDAPTAGLDATEDTWTVERLLESEDAYDTSPRTEHFTVAEHIATGRLAGFTGLSVPAQPERSVIQESTLVLREHRGHGLGMALKLASVQHLEKVAPGHPSITTFNAEENRHMLAVNQAMGFVAVASDGVWRKLL